MTKRLKRVAPIKFGLVMGILYGLISLVMVPFFMLMVVISALVPNQEASTRGIGLVLGLIFTIFIPVLYAIVGGLMGMLGAWLYNVVASWIGGIEFEVE